MTFYSHFYPKCIAWVHVTISNAFLCAFSTVWCEFNRINRNQNFNFFTCCTQNYFFYVCSSISWCPGVTSMNMSCWKSMSCLGPVTLKMLGKSAEDGETSHRMIYFGRRLWSTHFMSLLLDLIQSWGQTRDFLPVLEHHLGLGKIINIGSTIKYIWHMTKWFKSLWCWCW